MGQLRVNSQGFITFLKKIDRILQKNEYIQYTGQLKQYCSPGTQFVINDSKDAQIQLFRKSTQFGTDDANLVHSIKKNRTDDPPHQRK